MPEILLEHEVGCRTEAFSEHLSAYLASAGAANGTLWYEIAIQLEELGLPHFGQYGRDVLMSVGEPLARWYATLIPLSWHAADNRVLPRFDGWIVAVPLDGGRTHVALLGAYEPPIGTGGFAVEPMLAVAMAETAIGQVLDQIKAGVEEYGKTAG